MKFSGLAGWVFAGLMSVTGGVYAQNIITALTVGYNSGVTIVKVDLVRPLSKLPDTEFVVGSSPHIAFEFSDTANGLGESVQDFTEGGLRSANIVQSGERTRLVLYLDQMFPYNFRIEGNSLLIALQGNAGNADGIALRPAESKQDAQRRMLASETIARLKAEQEARATAEEKTKQAAAAKAAKIKAIEEAKAEAKRIKAEQKTKAEAAALARQQATAEATRLAAEQKAKVKAEKQAAALAKQAAKAEAARLAAEQKAKIKAEKQAAILARQAAEAEAARLAAEQQAKIKAEKEAAALAKQAAEAESARLAAEQQAKIEAEKQAIALAKQAEEAKAARLAMEQKAEAEKQATELARQAAEAEVARQMAKWVMVGQNKILALTAYAAPSTETISKNGKKEKKGSDTLKMWRIYDYKTTQEASGYKFLSAKFQDEYDCKEGQTRILVNTTFSGNMGVGEVVFTNADAGNWQPVMHGSIGEAMWKFACKKK